MQHLYFRRLNYNGNSNHNQHNQNIINKTVVYKNNQPNFTHNKILDKNMESKTLKKCTLCKFTSEAEGILMQHLDKEHACEFKQVIEGGLDFKLLYTILKKN